MAVPEHKWIKPALGAGAAALCGLALWQMPLGDPWVNASYDYLFRFGNRTPTNQVVLLLMDNQSFAEYGEDRGAPWKRSRYVEVLNRLAEDGAARVIFDVHFGREKDPVEDQALVQALKRQKSVVLMAEQVDPSIIHQATNVPSFNSVGPDMPGELFLRAAQTNWGVAWFNQDLDRIVRKHWPFPAPGAYPSLAWTVAQLSGAHLSLEPQEQWLRYYGQNGGWDSLSYCLATKQAKGFFKDKTVFIGNKPRTTVPDDPELDKFCIPYTRWTGEAVGGVELSSTAFLNLVNGEWLRRPPAWVEIASLILSGLVVGVGLCLVRPLRACGLAAGVALLVTLTAVWLSQVTNYWFPWLVIAGGQVPCALILALAGARIWAVSPVEPTTVPVTPSEAEQEEHHSMIMPRLRTPEVTDYEIFKPAIGEGAFGRVWLVRNSIHQWQALKAVYLSNFGSHTGAYDREFKGIEKYKPISDKHPALLRVDFVSMKKPEGYFYYVMELGDAMIPGWESTPSKYVPKDLAKVRAQAEGRRLPIRECVRIGLSLTAGLDFLHRQGLTHRDVKPQNIIFVKGEPKLADVGLVAEIRPPGEQLTMSGTPGYMPPPPERPGTPGADIYGLGMVLYVMLTGRDPMLFPELATTLLEAGDPAEFMRLNRVILKACDPDLSHRYATAAEMAVALREVETTLPTEFSNTKIPGAT